MRSKMNGGVLVLIAICAVTAYKPSGGDDISGTRSIQSGTKDSYRIYHNESYKIVDTAGFYLYYRYVQYEHTKGKGLIKKDQYYFSKDSNSDIWLLTIENLKSAYPENHRFHYDLDAHFWSDRDLMAYDPYIQMYKLKYLYMRSLNM